MTDIDNELHGRSRLHLSVNLKLQLTDTIAPLYDIVDTILSNSSNLNQVRSKQFRIKLKCLTPHIELDTRIDTNSV
jgi:hypothetical protein